MFLMGDVEGDDSAAILINDLNTEYILPLFSVSHFKDGFGSELQLGVIRPLMGRLAGFDAADKAAELIPHVNLRIWVIHLAEC